MEHLLKAKGLWGMLMETETLAADANAAAQAEFTRRRERAFSMLVPKCKYTPVVSDYKLSNSQRGVDHAESPF